MKLSCGSKYYLAKTFSGTVSGQLGCGCTAYMHKSPTRTAWKFGATRNTTDVASVFGNWKATYISKESRSLIIIR